MVTRGIPLGRGLHLGLREWLRADDVYNAAGERVAVGRSTIARRRLERLRHRDDVVYCEFLVERAVERGKQC